MVSTELNLSLHPKQAIALNTKATEVLYGGAAGGGKSHLMRVAAILWCAEIAGLQVYLFRRIEDDLVKNHMEGPSGFRSLLAGWEGLGWCQIVESEIRFWNGSRIYLCHCKDEAHRFKYQGSEIHVLMIDELGHFTETIYRFLRHRVRMSGITLPKKYEGLFPRILCSANPGGIGHSFVKSTFIELAEPYKIMRVAANEGGMLRQFIPARLEDNPSLQESDPLYVHRLSGLGSEALVKAIRDGDWNIVEGAYFNCWSTARHVIRPFEIPAHWVRARSFDWGSASPFSVGWWAIASEQVTSDGKVVPRGALVRYREWYGASAPKTGLKMTTEEIGRGILAREADGEKIDYSVADPSIFASDGGPSKAETMARLNVHFRPADNKRAAGWDQLRQRLVGDGDGNPMIYCFDSCLESIRTIPILQHDTRKPEDLDTNGEDHAADEWRYMCMSRPWIRVIQPPKAREILIKPLTISDIERHVPRRLNRI